MTATRARSHSLSSCSSCAAIAAMPAWACAIGDAGLHAGEDAQDDDAARRPRGIDPDRAPDIRRDDGRLKSPRHDADDRRRLAVEENRAADQAGIAIEEPRPHRVADDGDGRAVRLVLLLGEGPAGAGGTPSAAK